MRLIRVSKSLLILMAFGSFTSCELINPDEQIPAFVEIKAMKVAPDANFGTSSSKIKDVWVYCDNNYMGTFELPAKFPILKTGKHTFRFAAGILKNGIASTREDYPFYQFATDTLELKEDETLSLDTLTVKYFPNITIYNDDFESGTTLDTLKNSLRDIEIDHPNAFEGSSCLKMMVNDPDSIVECGSQLYYPIPLGKPAYLEMNYKCDFHFYVGLLSLFPDGSTYTTIIMQVNPTESWNKIYVDLSAAVTNNYSAIGHRLYFLFKRDPSSVQNTVYLDNLKLVRN